MSKRTRKRAADRARKHKELAKSVKSRTDPSKRTVGKIATFHNENNKPIVKRKVSLDIIRTNDYTAVKPNWKWNRVCDVNSSSYRKIKKSMEEEGYRTNEPIIVNSQGWITSGNHRYHAAKELRIEYCYLVSDMITSENIISKSNQGKNWSLEEAFGVWVQHKYPDYIKVEDLRVKYSFPLRIAISVCMNRPPVGGHKGDEIKIGKMKLDEKVFSKAEKRAKQMRDIIYQEYFIRENFSNSAYLQYATLYIMNHEKYDHKRMIYVLSSGNVGDIRKVGTVDRWIEQLLDLYNYKLKTENKIFIDSKTITMK